MTLYDAVNKQIREYNTTSAGNTTTYIYSKTANGWRCTAIGSNSSGDKTSGLYECAISDDGSVNTWTGTTTIAGKEEDPLHDVWRRVSK